MNYNNASSRLTLPRRTTSRPAAAETVLSLEREGDRLILRVRKATTLLSRAGGRRSAIPR